MSELASSGSAKTSRNALLIALAAIALLWLLVNLYAGRGEQTLEVAQETAGATAAEVRLQLGVTELQLDSSATPGLLLEGQAGSRGRERLTESFTLRSGVAVYRLTSRQEGLAFMQGRSSALWDMHLNPSLPTDLRVEAGVGRINLELGDALLNRLDLDLGVGAATVTLPRELIPGGSLPVSISAGIGNLTLRIERAAPVHLKIESGLGVIDVSGDLERDDSTYSSPTYSAGAPAFEVNIDGGIGRVSIVTY